MKDTVKGAFATIDWNVVNAIFKKMQRKKLPGNNQTENGIVLPEVLHNYFVKKILL